VIIMAATNGSDKDMQTQTDEYYEEIASQEQAYLDEVEARLIDGLTSAEAMRLMSESS
jgi:hypothetical protein